MPMERRVRSLLGSEVCSAEKARISLRGSRGSSSDDDEESRRESTPRPPGMMRTS